MGSQSRKGSLIESLTNIGIGIGVAFLSQRLVFPLYGIHVPIATNIYISLWFTAISLVRSYCVRRYFNRRV